MKKVCVSLFVLFLFIISVTPAFADEGRYQYKGDDRGFSIYDKISKKNILYFPWSQYQLIHSPESIFFVFHNNETGTYSLYDIRNAKYVFNNDCTYIEEYEDNIFLVAKIIDKMGTLYGLYDATNKKIIIPFLYENISAVGKNEYEVEIDYSRYFVSKDEKWGVVDKFNKIIIPIKYDDVKLINKYDNSKYIVWKDGKCGIIDKFNKILIPVKYDKIEDENGKYFSTYTSSNIELYDTTNNKIIFSFPKDKYSSLYLKGNNLCVFKKKRKR